MGSSIDKKIFEEKKQKLFLVKKEKLFEVRQLPDKIFSFPLVGGQVGKRVSVLANYMQL